MRAYFLSCSHYSQEKRVILVHEFLDGVIKANLATVFALKAMPVLRICELATK